MELQVTRPDKGFTLIELMVVIVIVTILLSIAIPNYLNYVRQARRSEAKTTLLDLAGREETYFSTNGAAYTAAPTALGFSAAWGAPFGSGYYSMQGYSPAAAPSAAAAPSYSFTATAIGTQVNDTQCATFSVDSTGTQWAFTSAGVNNTAYCWAN
jgi:type IV pilus assembly protein PilE